VIWISDRRHLDTFFGLRAYGYNALDEDTGEMDLVGIEFSQPDDRFHFRNGHPSGHGAKRVEVARRRVEDEITLGVTECRPNDREIGDDGFFEEILMTRKLSFGGDTTATDPSLS